MSISGVIANGNNLQVTNNGEGGLTTTDTSDISANGMLVLDNNAGDMSLAGALTNTGVQTQILNSGNNATVNGTINNANSLHIINDGIGFLSVGADIVNGDNTTITNSGTDLSVGGSLDNEGNL